ncbi:MAG: hypothetical protein P1U64_08215 [Alcanivoracaceae bacterium]|nr:hypothetical protein [Alcanivoracaceae bacterium]
MIRPIFVLLVLWIGSADSVLAADLDVRLEDFLDKQIESPKVLEQTKNVFEEGDMDFETFILVAFTGAAKMDGSPDNMAMLSKLGMYIENEKPRLRPGLLLRMQGFMRNPTNRTMMRGVFMETVRANIMGDEN